ncbi:MAG: DUF4258 domain-containing protein [Rhizobium sp.]|nr:DUF4258 domain-containing protein [Rhizobium sp.]
MNKPLRFTAHSQTVIVERQLDTAWIERTLREPDWREAGPSGPPTERRYQRIPECAGRFCGQSARKTKKKSVSSRRSSIEKHQND